jgi:hypothetical protein
MQQSYHIFAKSEKPIKFTSEYNDMICKSFLLLLLLTSSFLFEINKMNCLVWFLPVQTKQFILLWTRRNQTKQFILLWTGRNQTKQFILLWTGRNQTKQFILLWTGRNQKTQSLGDFLTYIYYCSVKKRHPFI